MANIVLANSTFATATIHEDVLESGAHTVMVAQNLEKLVAWLKMFPEKLHENVDLVIIYDHLTGTTRPADILLALADLHTAQGFKYLAITEAPELFDGCDIPLISRKAAFGGDPHAYLTIVEAVLKGQPVPA